MPSIHSIGIALRTWTFAGACLAIAQVLTAAVPQVGEVAPEFVLKTLDDRTVSLQQLARDSAVVLVVLRGWPGYQCPVCTRQVQDFMAVAGQFETGKGKVVMVYPGPAEQLKHHAEDFLHNKDWPASFSLVLDPDYTFTHAYGLRWDAPKETAYPSTFVIERGGRIRFAQVSRTHGGRSIAARVIAELKRE